MTLDCGVSKNLFNVDTFAFSWHHSRMINFIHDSRLELETVLKGSFVIVMTIATAATNKAL